MNKQVGILGTMASAIVFLAAFQNCTPAKNFASQEDMSSLSADVGQKDELIQVDLGATDDASSNDQPPGSVGTASSAYFVGKRFKVVGFLPKDGCKYGGQTFICSRHDERDPKFKHVISFHEASVTAHLACNVLQGKYTATGKSPKWDVDLHVSGTQIGCHGIIEETQVQNHLNRAKELIVLNKQKGEILLMTSDFGGLRLREIKHRATIPPCIYAVPGSPADDQNATSSDLCVTPL